MKPNESDRETTYHIRIKESLDQNFTDWLGDLTLIPLEDGKTLLVGPFVDQSALRGLLNQLWNLNITVISVDKIENENQQESSIVEHNQGET